MKYYYSELKVTKVGERAWKLTERWVTPYGVVPRGFISNGANIPRILWLFMTPAGLLFEASVLHDFFYDTAKESKEEADLAFYNAALDFGVDKFKAKLAYLAVKLIGRGNY